MKDQQALGVDIGNVILDGMDTTFFTERYLKTRAIPNAFEALRILTLYFGENIFIVSRSGPKSQEKTLNWLKYNNFYELTGIKPDNRIFCDERHEKAPICKELGVTHFIDDRLEVLNYLIEIVPNLYLFQPKPKDIERYPLSLRQINQVQNWQEVLTSILSPRL